MIAPPQINILHLGNNLAYLRTLPDASVDTIITDSPYGLGKEPDPIKVLQAWITTGYYEVSGKGFMGKKWDAFVPQPALWKECYRVLKPGGHLLSFFGTRTYDWGTLAIRLAGFDIRDCIQWIYGTGYPKSKSHLKPANEPICVARKPGELWPLVSGCKSDKVYEQRIERWPANVMIDESVADLIDEQSPKGTPRYGLSKRRASENNTMSGANTARLSFNGYPDAGGASRFFYVSKACNSERLLPDGTKNKHPTVKPVKLMEHLVKLYSPIGGIVLDPHIGSGTTAVACINTGRQYIGIDDDESSIDIATMRTDKAYKEVNSKLFQPDA